MRTTITVTVLALCALGTGGLHAQSILGPTPYLGFADSPFNPGNPANVLAGASFQSFLLEDFEDNSIDLNGIAGTSVTISSGFSIFPSSGSSGIVDSVENGVNGRSLFGGGVFTVTFTGTLPTHAGIVWTDGGNQTFQAFGETGNSLGTVTGTHADGSISGTQGEDRFYGAVNPTGISRISFSSGTTEYDHLQFGVIPEPSSGILVCFGAVAVFLTRRRRRFHDREVQA